MSLGFWQEKRVLITGHTGFKGSWLALWLQILGADLLGYALKPSTQPNLFELAQVAEGMRSVLANIQDLHSLQEVLLDYRPEIVFHLAAQPLVRESYNNPVETYATNVMGAVNVLEAVRNIDSVRAVVNVTSDKCYENREWFWGYRENEPMGGYDPYSSSKGCAELVTAAYRNSFFNPDHYLEHRVAIATARAGNVIGGGDWAADRLLPDILNSWLAGKPVIIRNPQAIRPWQHVLEPLNGYLSLAKHLYEKGPAFNGAWNFGPNESDVKPVAWVVEQLAARWPGKVKWTQDNSIQPHEAVCLKLDSSKAQTQLDWQPKLGLETALTWIVDWTKSFQAEANMREVTKSQITGFMELADR